MAKLQNVETIDMVNGEITAIKYDGAVYAKLDGYSKVGDLLLRVAEEVDNVVNIGDFYEQIAGDLSITGADEIWYGAIDGREVRGRTKYFVAFRKASASAPFAEMVVSRVEAVEQRMDAIEAKSAPAELTIGDRVLISGRSIFGGDLDGKFGKFVGIDGDGDCSVLFDGDKQFYFQREQLTKVAGTEAPVKPEFSVGDRVKALVVGEFNDIKCGEYGTINDLDEYADSDPYYIEVETDAGKTDFFRPQDLELAPADEAWKVGDYAVVITSDRVLWTYAIGDVVPVVGFRKDGFPIVQTAGKKEEPMHSSQLRKATEAEVAAALAPAKPKTGDIVVITANTNGSQNKVGDIGVVRVGGENSLGQRQVNVIGRKDYSNWTEYSEMRLATPAEIAKYETAKASALKPKEPTLKVGDTVRVEGSMWFKDGTITKVIRLGGHGGTDPRYVLLEGGAIGLSVETEYVTKVDADSVFTKAGRKPNEYRKGDVVKVLEKSHTGSRNMAGDIGVVTEVEMSGLFVDVPARVVPYASGNHHVVRNVEIVCFAENRADAKGVA